MPGYRRRVSRSRLATSAVRSHTELLEPRILMAVYTPANTSAITVSGGGPGSPYPSPITLGRTLGSITDVNVTFKAVSHTAPYDLDILLVGPGGKSVVLMSDCGGLTDIVGVDITIDDEAFAPLPNLTALTTGTYRPMNYGTGDSFSSPAPAGPYGSSLSVFDGGSASGTWNLYVMDDLISDNGTIAGGWTLTITTAVFYEYGDAPAPYPTLAASDGARHIHDSTVYLGTTLDVESEGQPSAGALLDDQTGSADDDGVVFTSALAGGSSAGVQVTASVSGYLNAWMDFNGNGSWADAGDQIFADTPLSAGVNTLSFPVLTTPSALTYARFRFNTTGGLSFTGLAFDGEVEDYALGAVSGRQWNDYDGDGTQDPGEPGRSGVQVYVDVNGNGQLDTNEPTAVTAGNGSYAIGGLPPGSYIVRPAVASGYSITHPLPGVVAQMVNVAGHPNTGIDPPDTVGDIGPAHYVQAVNGSLSARVAIFNTDGSAAVPSFQMNSLASGAQGGSAYTGRGDPIVLYDHLAARWLLMEIAIGDLLQIFISDTSTPTGNGADWTQYVLTAPNLPDYPKLALFGDAYYIGTNETGEPAYALDRTAMLNGTGGALSYIRKTTPPRPNWPRTHIMPVDVDGVGPPAGAKGLFVRQVDDEWTNPATADPTRDYLEVWEFDPDFAVPANSTYTLADTIYIDDFDYTIGNTAGLGRDDLPQPGTAVKLDAVPHYMGWRVQYRSFRTHEAMVGSFTVDVGTDHAGVRWFELRKSGGQWSLYQEGTYAPDASHRWMSSIAMDAAGSIALGYSVTNATDVYPGIRYAARLASDPLGTLPRGEESLIEGGSFQNGSRWGDYSALTVDPVTQHTFWITNEYIAAGSSSWSTRVGSFSLSSGSNRYHYVSVAFGQTVSARDFGVHDVTAPKFTVSLNGGAAQRSMLTRVTITFDEPVTLSAGALKVLLSSGADVAGVNTVLTNIGSDLMQYRLTFTGASAVGGSLPDGIYDLKITASGVHDLSGNALAASYTQRFHRLFGDNNGDRRVNLVDYRALRTTLGKSVGQGLFNDTLDYDGGGVVDVLDLAQFRRRFGQRLVY